MRGRKRTTMFALLALLGAVALLAAGCGGGDSETAADETTVETTTDTETMDETTTSDETTEDTDTGNLSPFASEDCLSLVSAMAAVGQAMSGSAADADATAAFEELAGKAPDEIKDDLAVLSSASGEIVEALKDIDMAAVAAGDQSEIQKLEGLSTTFSSAEYTEASQNVEAWMTANCKTGG